MKNFNEWNILKQELNNRNILKEDGKIIVSAKAKELWWCHIGVNIGNEQDGKNMDFERPVIVISKLSPSTYLIIPTTSKFKENKFRIKTETEDGKFSYALIDQIKVIDVRRLKRKISYVKEEEFGKLISSVFTLVINCEIPLARDFSEPEGTVNTV